MIFRFPALVVLAASLFFHSAVMAGVNKDIRIEIEEPAGSEAYAGISNLRGWAVAPRGVDRVEVFIDGAFAFELPIGGARGDVGQAFPSYPDSDLSGFSMAFNYKNLTLGIHEITIRAFDSWGDYNDRSVTFKAEKFNSAFIPEEKVNLASLQNIYVLNPKELLFMGAWLDGEDWDFVVSWDTPSQGLKLHSVSPAVDQSRLRAGDVMKEICSGTSKFIVRSDGDYGISSVEYAGEDCGFTNPNGATPSWQPNGNTSSGGNGGGSNSSSGSNTPSGGSASNTSNSANTGDGSSGSKGNAPPSSAAPSGEVFACVTSPDDYYHSGRSVVTMKNGLKANNFAGDEWLVSDEHVVFETLSGKWYSIKNDVELLQLDVLAEPKSCFDFNYGLVREVKAKSASSKTLVFSGGEITVSTNCPIDLNSKVGAYGTSDFIYGDRLYVVDLLNARTCKIESYQEY